MAAEVFDYDGLVFSRQGQIGLERRISIIQKVLAAKGYYTATVDADFGDLTEKAVKKFQADASLTVDGIVNKATGNALGLPFWTPFVELELVPPYRDDTKYPDGTKFRFQSLWPGGFYSSWAHRGYHSDNPMSKRALRSNNPGAVNISNWQRDTMKGYVGRTEADASSDANKTTIYSAPEYGVAMWAFLLRVKYFNGRRDPVSLRAIIDKYRGGLSPDPYLAGYKKYSQGVLEPNSMIDLYKPDQLGRLAIAAYSHELGFWFPLTNGQMDMAVAICDGYVQSWQGRAASQAEGLDPWSDLFNPGTARAVPAESLEELDSAGT